MAKCVICQLIYITLIMHTQTNDRPWPLIFHILYAVSSSSHFMLVGPQSEAIHSHQLPSRARNYHRHAAAATLFGSCVTSGRHRSLRVVPEPFVFLCGAGDTNH